jgi:hypothetical protein
MCVPVIEICRMSIYAFEENDDDLFPAVFYSKVPFFYRKNK